MRRVLVTRPEPGASQTAGRLEALGFAPLLLPLFDTHSLFIDGASIPRDVDAVAVTSANAIRHAPRALVGALAQAPCFAVGERTAEASRAAGFSRVIEGAGDAGGLARTIIAAGTSRHLVYLCGRTRRPVFEETLAAAGITVKAIEVYDAVRIDYAPASIIPIVGGQPVEIALLYSANAAAALVDLLERPELGAVFENTIFLCMSARVAAELEGRVPGKIRIAAEPTEEALLSLLGESG